MDAATFDQLTAKLLTDCQNELALKGRSYAPGEDRLANFKRNADALGLDPMVVWIVYAGKHWDAIQSYVRDRDQNVSEPLRGRFIDLINYCLLGSALLHEQTFEGVPGLDVNERTYPLSNG